MAALAQDFSLLIFSLHIHYLSGEAKTLTITNNCSYTVWPGIISISSTLSNNDSEFALLKGGSEVIPVQNYWSGQVWGKTLCATNNSNDNFSRHKGDCTNGKLQSTSSFVIPMALAEFGFGQLDNEDFYDDENLVDGYNLPLMVAPHVDSSRASCNVTGCVRDKTTSETSIIESRGSCQVFKTNQYCCSNASDCQFTDYSLIFKRLVKERIAFLLTTLLPPSLVIARGRLHLISFSATRPPHLDYLPYQQYIRRHSHSHHHHRHQHYHRLYSYRGQSPSAKQNSSGKASKIKVQTALFVAFTTAAATLLFVLLGICIFVCRRKAIENNNAQTNEIRRFADSLQFEFNTIRSATRNFAADNKLGEGGFGEVYKGELKCGQEIAVKRLSQNSVQGVTEFDTEIVLVAKLQHRNLVKLLGYCTTPKESLLVYEFLPNSSLDKYLFDPDRKSSLDWQTRFQIISGIARGVMYLHEDSRIKVIHRDLKSSNILLDKRMNPMIADFGLARLFGVDQTEGDTKRIVGTYGYMAPEYATTGHYSVKTDVYSFGVIVLEIVSGQRSRLFGRVQLGEPLLHRAWRLWNEDEAFSLIDREIGGNIEKEDALKCIQIGLLCIQENAIDRPRITSIVAALNFQAICLPVPKVPKCFGYAEDETQEKPDGCETLYVYTGAETITDVYSRD